MVRASLCKTQNTGSGCATAGRVATVLGAMLRPHRHIWFLLVDWGFLQGPFPKVFRQLDDL